MYSTLFLSVVASLHGRELDLLLDFHKHILFFLSKTKFLHARAISWTDRVKNRKVFITWSQRGKGHPSRSETEEG